MQEIKQRIASIRDDGEHGSRWLARECILILRDLAAEQEDSPATQMQHIREVGRELAHLRPAMAALAGAVGRILAAPEGLAGIVRVAEQLLQEYEQTIPRITACARPLLSGTVMTHSLSGTVLEVLQACTPAIDQFIVLEGRPAYEGRTTAQKLQQQATQVTVITDAQADIFLPRCQAVVIGADSILADGGVLNKAGSALLARAAQGHSVPFYVLSETLKISIHTWSGDLSPLEEHPGHEVWRPANPTIQVRNFYFDHTPGELITGILSEQGPLDAAEIGRQARILQTVPEIA